MENFWIVHQTSTEPPIFGNFWVILGKKLPYEIIHFDLVIQSTLLSMSDTAKMSCFLNQDHTSHCHFCSMIDEFPVLIRNWINHDDEFGNPFWAWKGFIQSMVVYNIDDCELTTCQLKKGVLSEWQIIC